MAGTYRKRSAFTVIELAACVAAAGVAAALVAPTVHRVRVDARKDKSLNNLREIAVGRDQYAAANQGDLYSFTWNSANFEDIGAPAMEELGYFGESPDDTVEATGVQLTEILARITGRTKQIGSFGLRSYAGSSFLPHDGFLHVPLGDFLGLDFPNDLFVSPLDRALTVWADPDYISAQPGGWVPAGEGRFNSPVSRQYLPYSSSYDATVSHWASQVFPARDGEGRIFPAPNTAALLGVIPGGTLPDCAADQYDPREDAWACPLRPRSLAEVAHPSAKVHLYEEFAWNTPGELHFSYADAPIRMVFYDGSAGTYRTGESDMGWDAGDPLSGEPFIGERYLIDSSLYPNQPDARSPNRTAANPGWYEWTRDGLAGIDYATRTPLPDGPAVREVSKTAEAHDPRGRNPKP